MATDLIKGMLDLTKHLEAEDISLLVEPLHTFSENIKTPDATEGIVKLLQDKRTKEGLGDMLSVIDPDLLGNLLPVLGSVGGAVLVELTKNEKVKDARLCSNF